MRSNVIKGIVTVDGEPTIGTIRLLPGYEVLTSGILHILYHGETPIRSYLSIGTASIGKQVLKDTLIYQDELNKEKLD